MISIGRLMLAVILALTMWGCLFITLEWIWLTIFVILGVWGIALFREHQYRKEEEDGRL